MHSMSRYLLFLISAVIGSASPLTDRAIATLAEVLEAGPPVDQIHAAEAAAKLKAPPPARMRRG
jgi:hypothetical protein